jgi:uncharacterized membrane protein YeiH
MIPGEILFLVATAIFSATGVLATSRHSMDVLSLVIVGVVTAIGGGTIRDLLLDVPVFWLRAPEYLYVAAAAAAAAFFFERWIRETERLLLYLDGIAMAMFAALALNRVLAMGFSPGVATVMGILTGVGGGVIRDVVTDGPTILLRRELYITPILVGASVFYALRALTPLEPGTCTAVMMALTAGLRLGSLRFGWGFPDWLVYDRPTRN